MAVEVHGDADLRVPEHFHHYSGVDS
jgi:hypothetical protein